LVHTSWPREASTQPTARLEGARADGIAVAADAADQVDQALDVVGAARVAIGDSQRTCH
jgi:hypothetical protein